MNSKKKLIYTDGLKEGDKVAAATIVNNDIFCIRHPDETTIFTELAF